MDGTTLNDVFKAQSQLAQLNYDLILLAELRVTEATNINAILNLPPESPVTPWANTVGFYYFLIAPPSHCTGRHTEKTGNLARSQHSNYSFVMRHLFTRYQFSLETSCSLSA